MHGNPLLILFGYFGRTLYAQSSIDRHCELLNISLYFRRRFIPSQFPASCVDDRVLLVVQSILSGISAMYKCWVCCRSVSRLLSFKCKECHHIFHFNCAGFKKLSLKCVSLLTKHDWECFKCENDMTKHCAQKWDITVFQALHSDITDSEVIASAGENKMKVIETKLEHVISNLKDINREYLNADRRRVELVAKAEEYNARKLEFSEHIETLQLDIEREEGLSGNERKPRTSGMRGIDRNDASASEKRLAVIDCICKIWVSCRVVWRHTVELVKAEWREIRMKKYRGKVEISLRVVILNVLQIQYKIILVYIVYCLLACDCYRWSGECLNLWCEDKIRTAENQNCAEIRPLKKKSVSKNFQMWTNILYYKIPCTPFYDHFILGTF